MHYVVNIIHIKVYKVYIVAYDTWFNNKVIYCILSLK